MEDDEFAVESLEPAWRSAGPQATPLTRRLTTRNRFVRAGMVIALVAAVTGVLVARLPQGLGAEVLPPATPAGPDPTHLFTWAHGVPWGALHVDGDAMVVRTSAPASSTLGISAEPQPIILAAGHHTLAYVAPPFPTRTCAVDVPSRGADTCAETTVGESGMRKLDLGATPDALPLSAYAALQASIQQALDAEEANLVLDPGVRFLGPNGQITTSAQKLVVQPRYLLDASPPSANAGGGSGCPAVCDFGGNASYDPTWWTVLASLRVTLDYRRPGGTPLYVGIPVSPDPAASHVLVPIAVAWSSAGWRVRAPNPWPATSSPFCSVATNVRRQIHSDPALVPAVIAIEWKSATDVPLFRCLLAGDEGEPLRPASAKARRVLLLYQFGLLLAASPAARQIFPKLPVASPAEQRLADQFNPPAL